MRLSCLLLGAVSFACRSCRQATTLGSFEFGKILASRVELCIGMKSCVDKLVVSLV